jgi:lambda family phage portal protein
MKFLDKIARRIGYVSAKAASRAYAGAVHNRFTEDWKTFYTSIDRDIYMALQILRARSRDLVQNNDYARRFIRLCMMNIVGPSGFSLQVKSFDWVQVNKEWTIKYDELANRIIEEAFKDWSKRKHCSVTGTQSFIDIQKLIIQHASRDGEFLVRKIYNKKSKYGFQLQVLQPDLLDERLNRDLTNGNYIRMGIEFDGWRKPVAYWLKQLSPSNEFYSGYQAGTNYERIDAKDIYHGFDAEHSSQSRGVPWMTASMYRMRMLGGYEEAAVKNARAGSNKMGFFTSENGEKMLGDGVDAQGNIVSSGEPGSFEQLPPGVQFVPYDPKFPSEQHGSFVKAILRGIASGLGVGYNTFANDLEGVNYSSIRAGVIDEREMWKSFQVWFTESLLEPLFEDWLDASMLKKAINLPFTKFDKFNAPRWIGRRWAWVDPMKDMEAHVLARQAGFETSTEIIAEQGGDIEEKYAGIAREQALAKKHGLVLKIDEIKVGSTLAPSTQEPDQTSQSQKSN